MLITHLSLAKSLTNVILWIARTTLKTLFEILPTGKRFSSCHHVDSEKAPLFQWPWSSLKNSIFGQLRLMSAAMLITLNFSKNSLKRS